MLHFKDIYSHNQIGRMEGLTLVIFCEILNMCSLNEENGHACLLGRFWRVVGESLLWLWITVKGISVACMKIQ